jgi:pimeloyl-ACP methyl ester carboxylesterase
MSARKSTNGRSMRTRLRLQRLAFGSLEWIAPRLGGGWLDKIWFTLAPVPEKARRSRVELPLGTPFEVSFRGRQLRGISWGTGRNIYLVHGWGGWGLQLAAYVPPLVAAGFRVLAYDAPSHGASDPGHAGARRTDLPEMAEALRAVVAARGPAYGVIAHSLGAAATGQAMLHGLAARRVVFVAAATAFDHTLNEFQRMFGFGPRIRAAFERSFVRRFGRPMESFQLRRTVDELQEERELPPLLAIHDSGDRETPYQGSVAVVDAWPGARLELTEGLGHRKVLGDPSSVAAVVAFLSASQAISRGGRVGEGTMQA